MKFTLKQARLIKGYTQVQMAKLLGIHVQTYQKLEKHPDEVTVRQAKQLSDILDFSYDFIFFNNHSTFSRVDEDDSIL